MYNPFPLFSQAILRDRISVGKRYFVRQTFPRGHEGRLKAAFLICGYSEKHLAEEHLEKLACDGNRFLYDVEIIEHLEKLHVAAGQPFGYKIYYAGKIGADWKPPVDYQKKIRQYIRNKHPDWKGNDGDYFSKPNEEEIREVIREMMGE